MAFIVYEATLPEKRGVNKLTTRQKSHANDFVHAKSHARENFCSQGKRECTRLRDLFT